MEGFSRFLYLMMVLMVSGTVMAQNPQSPAKPLPLSLTISAEQDTVVAGSPVIVRTSLTNTSGQDFGMWITLGEPYLADVRDANGGTPPPTKWNFYHDYRFDVGRVLGTSVDLDLRLLNGNRLYVTYKANESEVSSVGISYLYNFDEPGTYTIILRLAAFPAVKSNPVTVTVVPAATATSAPASAQVPASAPFSLDIKADDAVRPGLPVDVLAVTKNVSTHSIVLRRQEHAQDRGVLGSVFRVEILDSQGNPPADTQLGQSTNHLADTPPDPASMAAARAAGTVVSLKPGEDWRNTIRVSDLYDLSKPGQHSIQVRRWDGETKTWVKSNTVTVTVTP